MDSGDLHDGTGLSDGFPPGGIDAHDVSRSSINIVVFMDPLQQI